MIDPTMFECLQGIVEKNTGIKITDEKKYLIEQRLVPLAKKFEFESIGELCKKLVKNPDLDLLDAFFDAIVTNETSFYRDRRAFDVLSEHTLPALIENREQERMIRKRRFRIWSAACSTGQEPYSIALTILKFIESNPKLNLHPDQFEISASDISHSVLDFAEKSVYSRFDIERGLSREDQRDYFTAREDGHFDLAPDVRRMVRFNRFNLLDPTPPGGPYDIIFCRNVLYYFSIETGKSVLETLGKGLRPGGILFIGSNESLMGMDSSLSRQGVNGYVFYTASVSAA